MALYSLLCQIFQMKVQKLHIGVNSIISNNWGLSKFWYKFKINFSN
jgi:hypothetical protein